MARSRARKEWIQKVTNPGKKGALHRALGVPEDKKIPEKKLEKGEHSKSRTVRQEANFARTMKRLHSK